MRAVLARVARRKRASVLLLLGAIFAVNGYVILDTAEGLKRFPQASLSYEAHTDVLPMEAWGWLFLVVGVASALAGWFRRLPAWAGFAGLQGLSTIWGLLFVASWAQTDYGRAWFGALQWANVAGVLAIIAGWEDPPADTRAADAVVAELAEDRP